MNREVYHPRYGRGVLIEARGDRWTVRFKDADVTKTILKRFLKPPPRRDQRQELEAHLMRASDDLQSWLVYADLLQQENDARGEIIALELEDAPHEAMQARLQELYRTNRAQWLGKLAQEPEEVLELSWRKGFIETARIRRHPVRLLNNLLERSASRFLCGLELRRIEGSEALIGLLERIERIEGCRLEWLELQLDSLGDSGAMALARFGQLGALRALHIEWNTMTSAGKQALLEAEAFPKALSARLERRG